MILQECFITTVTHNQRGIQRSLCLFIKLLIHFCDEPSGNTSKSNRKNTEAVFEFQRQKTTTKKEKNILKGFSPDMISFTARVENSCCCEINSRELNRNTQKTNSR